MRKSLYFLLFCTFTVSSVNAQFFISQEERDSINKLGNEVQETMLKQLGVQQLRPGRSGNPADKNSANYNESLANPCPELPELLVTKKGEKVTDANTWWKIRRPEIVEDFEREVYGRVPKNVPKVTWEVDIVDKEFVRRTPVIAKKLTGHVDNSSYPAITVNIDMMLVVPTNVK